MFGFLYTFIVALIANLRNREYRALTANLETEARQSDLSRQVAESKLKLLQLQIEPHFLFNTLGSAQQLAEKGAPEAARLIGDLIRFLRATTPTLRDDANTVRQDASMIRAYLRIMQTRLAHGCAGRSPSRRSSSTTAMPPGMLITLVENAIKHGIEPSARQAADISVTAEREVHADGPVLRVRRRYRCRGLAAQPGDGGIGLANIRERLALLFGERATLATEANAPRGFHRPARPAARACVPARATVASFSESAALMTSPHCADRRGRAADARAAEGKARRGMARARYRCRRRPTAMRRSRCSASARPQIAFLDIRMPGKTGLDVAAAIGGRLPRGVHHRLRPVRAAGLRCRRRRLPAEAGRERPAARQRCFACARKLEAAARRPVGAGRGLRATSSPTCRT